MATGYLIHTPSVEKQALERWENEGGQLGQNHGFIFDSVGEDIGGTRTKPLTFEAKK